MTPVARRRRLDPDDTVDGLLRALRDDKDGALRDERLRKLSDRYQDLGREVESAEALAYTGDVQLHHVVRRKGKAGEQIGKASETRLGLKQYLRRRLHRNGPHAGTLDFRYTYAYGPIADEIHAELERLRPGHSRSWRYQADRRMVWLGSAAVDARWHYFKPEDLEVVVVVVTPRAAGVLGVVDVLNNTARAYGPRRHFNPRLVT